MKAVLAAALLGLALACAGAEDAPAVWRFDTLAEIGGAATHVEGRPQIVATPAGPAAAFDGKADALFIDRHPLAGAVAFTVEAVFRPDGGAFEQRWLHLAETDPKTGADTGARFLFEIRVVGNRWYLDSFVGGPGYRMALMAPDRTYPVGPWYRVEMTFDRTVFRSFVDGVLQAEAPVAFRPQGPGHASVGVRINRVSYFRGAIYAVRFTPRALSPREFMALPAGINGPAD